MAKDGYSLFVTPAAQRDLRRLGLGKDHPLTKTIDGLKSNPRPFGVKKLDGRWADYYRVREGNFRALYTIDDRNKRITIARVGDRKNVY